MSDNKFNGPCIGIDLGTTNSCVGVWVNGKVEIIANDQGNRTTPSYVSFTDSERLIGDAAKHQATRNTTNTVYDAKRLIGRYFNDKTVQGDIKHLSYKVLEDKQTKKPLISVKYKNEFKTFTPEEISSMVLTKMKNIAEAYLGEKVENAVITVPAYFNDAQRQATKDAGKIAGLNVMRIINEPTAAALAYGLNKEGERNVLVFDCGGGTHDVSILTIDDGMFEVKATNGDTHLGGEDLDNNIMEWCCKEYKKKYKEDLSGNKKALRRLRTACERAKRSLSGSTQAIIEIDALQNGNDFLATLTRAKFESLCDEEFRRCLKPVEQVLKDSKMSKSEINDIVLVGGSTRIPKIQQLLTEFFNGKVPKKDVNPDEAVAYGAAVQAAILKGDDEKLNDYILCDVTPLSIGVQTAGDVMSTLIERNSKIPTTHKETYSTYSDNQPGVDICIYEGERKFCKDNNLLGQFRLTEIPPMPRGQPQIEVKIDISSDGTMEVSATEKSTSKTNKIVIENKSGRLSDEQIKKMTEDAKKYEEDDRKAMEVVTAKNNLESAVYGLRNSLSDENIGGKLNETDKTEMSKQVEDFITWMDNNPQATKEEYDSKYEEVESLRKSMAVKMSGPPPSTEGTPSTGGHYPGPQVEEVD